MVTQHQYHLACPQCAAGLDPEVGERFLVCGHCGSSLFYDHGRVVHHWYMVDTLNTNRVWDVLRRWMEHDAMPRDLIRNFERSRVQFWYFPFWVFRLRESQEERLLIEPATGMFTNEIFNLLLPAGDLKPLIPEILQQVAEPTVSVQTLLSWFPAANVNPRDLVELSLIHLPLYYLQYRYAGREFGALIEGVTGMVFTSNFPRKDLKPYRALTCLTVLVFGGLSLLPPLGAVFNGLQGFWSGSILCSGLGLVLALVLTLLAAEVDA